MIMVKRPLIKPWNKKGNILECFLFWACLGPLCKDCRNTHKNFEQGCVGIIVVNYKGRLFPTEG